MIATEREPLTARQLEVYRAILAHFAETGGAPSLRELCEAMGISSPNGIMCHFTALTKKGWIEYDRTPQDSSDSCRARGLVIPEIAEVVRAKAAELMKRKRT
jgi:repressor LexA